MNSLTKYALGLQMRHQARLSVSLNARHGAFLFTFGVIGFAFLQEVVYGEFGGTDTPYGMLPNVFASLTDRKNFTRQEMFLKEKLVTLYEHNAYHEEQLRKGLEPKGEKLTLWM